jgi:TrmH family RNA methyltransferase
MVISSTSNPRIQSARRLRRRSGRDAAAAYLVEGYRAVTAALDAGAPVIEVFVDPDSDGADALRRAAQGSKVQVTDVSTGVVKALSDSSTPQGAVAILEAQATTLDDVDPDADLVLVLADVRDPGNAGTLVRSAVGAGAAAVLFGPGSVDPYNPKTVRSAAGHLWQARVIRDAPLGESARALRARGFTLVGTAAGATAAHHDADLTRRIAVVVGNEAWGLPAEARDLVDEVVGIPMPGPVESLNAAVAGSILLFEVVRQRGRPRDRQ